MVFLFSLHENDTIDLKLVYNTNYQEAKIISIIAISQKNIYQTPIDSISNKLIGYFLERDFGKLYNSFSIRPAFKL